MLTNERNPFHSRYYPLDTRIQSDPCRYFINQIFFSYRLYIFYLKSIILMCETMTEKTSVKMSTQNRMKIESATIDMNLHLDVMQQENQGMAEVTRVWQHNNRTSSWFMKIEKDWYHTNCILFVYTGNYTCHCSNALGTANRTISVKGAHFIFRRYPL